MRAHSQVPERSGTAAAQVWLGRAQHAGLAPGVVLATVLSLGLASLLRTPPPFVDEAWYASRAWSLIQTGRVFGPLDAGVFDRYEGYWTYFPWLGTWFQTLAVQAFGLSLFSIRLTSLLFGLVLLVAVYVTGRHFGGPRVGLLAMGLVAVSRPFIYSSHLGRHDVMVAALGFVAIALFATDRGSRFPLKSLLAGLAVGLAFEIHPNATIYGPAVVAMALADQGWPLLRTRRFRWLLLGTSAGLAVYVATHVLPYPRTYAALSALAFSATHTPPLLLPNPQLWLSAVRDMAVLSIASFDLQVLLLVAAGVAFWKRRSPADRPLLALFVTLSIGFLALIRTKQMYYAVLIGPAGALLMATFLDNLLHPGRSATRGTRRLAVLAVGLLMPAVAANLSVMLDNPMDDYQAALERVRQTVPAGSAIMGPQTYWLGLHEQPYFSWEQLVYYQRYAPDSTLQDALRAFRPDYLIIDRDVDKFITDRPGMMTTYFQSLSLPRSELNDFLEKQANLVGVVPTEGFGTIRIYQIAWSGSPARLASASGRYDD